MNKKLPNEQFRKLVEFINESRKDKSKKIYEDKEPREIDWVAYNQSQIENCKEALIFIKNSVDKCIDPPKKLANH